MPKPWYSIQASATAPDTANVDVIGPIHTEFGINAQVFLRDITAVEAGKIRLRINTNGGSVFEGLAMFNGLRATGKHITAQVLGVAASIGSYLAMAGDKITMPKNTMMFVHNPTIALRGNAGELRDAADLMDKMGEQILAAYRRRFKGSEEELQALFAAESYLTADECLAYGLCDEVTDEIAIEAKFDVDHLPANVQALLKQRPADPPAPAPAAAPVAVAPPAFTVQALEAMAREHGVQEHLVHLALDTTITSTAAASAAIERIKSVIDLCRVVNEAERLPEFIAQRKSFDDVRMAIATARATESDETHVSGVRPTPAPKAVSAVADFDGAALFAQTIANMKATRSPI